MGSLFSKVCELQKVCELKPHDSRINLKVKVVSSGRQMQTVEALVGDGTAMILFRASNAQVDLVKEGRTLILHNARILMDGKTMRLIVDRGGQIQVAEPANFIVNTAVNMSEVRYDKKTGLE